MDVMRLKATDLACIRGGRQVFSGVSFAVGAGEALVVTGPNGVGKSSLLRLLAGLVRPSAGILALDGGDPELTVAEQAHYLGHQDALKPALSVTENLDFWARFLGDRRADLTAPLAARLRTEPHGRRSPEAGRVWTRSRITHRCVARRRRRAPRA